MKISRTMLRERLKPIALHYFIEHTVHPTDTADYLPYIPALKAKAEAAGELDALKVGLEYVLTHFDFPILELNGGTYPFSESQMRDLIETVWSELWPEAQLPEEGAAPQVELVE